MCDVCDMRGAGVRAPLRRSRVRYAFALGAAIAASNREAIFMRDRMLACANVHT